MIQALRTPEAREDVLCEIRELARRGTTVREVVALLRQRLGYTENVVIPALWYMTEAFRLPLPEVLPAREWIDAPEDAALTEGGKVWPIAEHVLEERPYLRPPHRLSYSQILDRIECEMTEIEYADDSPTEYSLQGCESRPVFRFRVSEVTFDLLFNSSRGYRARYYDDPKSGPRADRELIEKVLDRLLAAWQKDKARTGGEERVRRGESIWRSLTKGSAKVWFNDGTFPGDRETDNWITKYASLTPETAEMLIPTWLREASGPSVHASAQNGLNAFRGEYLLIKGAFLNGEEERISDAKKNRAESLARYGFV